MCSLYPVFGASSSCFIPALVPAPQFSSYLLGFIRIPVSSSNIIPFASRLTWFRSPLGPLFQLSHQH